MNAYQTCLTQLFNFLGVHAGDNVIFCFTKTLDFPNNPEQRNAPLKSMLESLPTKNISFDKQKIFVFDSTYFLQSTIARYSWTFFDPRNRNCEESWKISKNGWNTLQNYVYKNLSPYFIHQGLQKVEQVRLEIKQIIRPILETIRNNIRNFVLSKLGYSNWFIELRPISLLYPSAICYSCQRNYYQFGELFIMSDSPHEYRNTCYSCSCTSDQHIRIDYRLEYKYSSNQTNYRPLQALTYKENLLYICVHLAHFIMHEDRITNNDPFLFYLNKIIDEERYIFENISFSRMNIALYHQLINFKHDYQRQIDIIKQKNNQNNYDVYDLIEKVKHIPMIKIQLDAARRIQETSV